MKKLLQNILNKMTMDKKRLRIIIGFVTLILLMGTTSIVLILTSSNVRGSSLAQIEPTLKPTVVDPVIKALQSELTDTDLSDIARKSVEEKLKMAEQMAEDRSIGANQPREEKVAPALPPGSPSFINPHDYEEGIFEGSEGMIRPSEAQISNTWQGMVNGHLTQIFAGAPADRSDQGVLYIFVENPVELKRSLTVLTAPGQTGRLRILAVENKVMTLEIRDGSKIFFDLETMEFKK